MCKYVPCMYSIILYKMKKKMHTVDVANIVVTTEIDRELHGLP